MATLSKLSLNCPVLHASIPCRPALRRPATRVANRAGGGCGPSKAPARARFPLRGTGSGCSQACSKRAPRRPATGPSHALAPTSRRLPAAPRRNASRAALECSLPRDQDVASRVANAIDAESITPLMRERCTNRSSVALRVHTHGASRRACPGDARGSNHRVVTPGASWYEACASPASGAV